MISIDDFAKVELRVAEILSARPHPKADKLMLLKVRVGGLEKQIVAGIKKHYQAKDLKYKKIIVVNNLKPVKLRGEFSEGMLLAASLEDALTLVSLDRDIPAGAKVR